MRIISKEHDYYDIGQGLGQDQSLVYLRTPCVVERRPKNVWYYGGNFSPYLIGFCGAVYPCLCMRHESRSSPLYSVEDCDQFIDKCGEDYPERYYPQEETGKHKLRRGSAYSRSHSEDDRRDYRSNQEDAKRFFRDDAPMIGETLLPLFQQYNTPIIVWSWEVTRINALLRPYAFFRIRSPYQAYQEIAQYVGGVLRAGTNPVPEPTNNTKIELAGFDLKHSFRSSKKKGHR
jgi:hypothetical protein